MAEATGLRNNALPYPVYGVPFGIVAPILDADGDPVTGATGLDSEVSLNGDTFADCTNEATEIATSSGIYYLLLTASEMTADVVTVQIKTSSSGAKTTVLTLYPRKLVELASGTSQGGAAGYITLAAATVGFDDQYSGCLCVATIDSVVEARVLSSCTASNQQCSVTPEWNTTPDSDDTYKIYLPEGMQIAAVNLTAIANNATNATNLGTAASNYSATRGLAGTALPAAAADAAGGLPISDAGGLDLDTFITRLDAAITTRHASGAAVAKSPATLDWSADVSNKPTIGTSTLTAADVWGYATRVLTANTNLGLPVSWPPSWPASWNWSTHSAADVWSSGTRTLTAFGFTVAATGNWSTHSAADVATLILVTPANKLATDTSGYVTSTNPGSGATAQQVWEYATRTLTANTNLGLPASWPASWPANWSWSTLDAAGVRTAVGLSLANLDAQLNAIVEDTGTTLPALIAAIEGGAGGAFTQTVTVTASGLPVQGATVELRDAADDTVIDIGTTDQYGVATVNCDALTVYLVTSKAGYASSTSADFTVAGHAPRTAMLSALNVTPSPVGQTTGYWVCYDEAGNVESGVSCSIQMLAGPGDGGGAFDDKIRTLTSNGAGLVQFTKMVPGATYQAKRGYGKWTRFVIPEGTGTTYALDEIVGREAATA